MISRYTSGGTILLRLNGDIKLHASQHTGGGKQADIPVKEAVERNLPPFVREDVGPELAGFHQQQSGTVHTAVVYHRPLLDVPAGQAAKDAVLLGVG